MSTPATVEIWESNGAGETGTKATNINFGTIDSPNLVAADHPLVIPIAGSVYSYQKFHHWKVISWVDTTTIDNLKWFNVNAISTAGWAAGWIADSNYSQPARSILADFSSFGGDFPTGTGSALSLTGSISNPTTGYIGTKYMVMNLFINNMAVAGNRGTHTFTYRYDES